MSENHYKCHCGGIILADTEDWAQPLCHKHYSEFLGSYQSELESTKQALSEAEKTIMEVLAINVSLKWATENEEITSEIDQYLEKHLEKHLENTQKQLQDKQKECDSLSEHYADMNIHLLELEVKIIDLKEKLKTATKVIKMYASFKGLEGYPEMGKRARKWVRENTGEKNESKKKS